MCIPTSPPLSPTQPSLLTIGLLLPTEKRTSEQYTAELAKSHPRAPKATEQPKLGGGADYQPTKYKRSRCPESFREKRLVAELLPESAQKKSAGWKVKQQALATAELVDTFWDIEQVRVVSCALAQC
jgi:hypothetical protein